MAHYAKVVNGIVTKVIVADVSFFDTFVDNSPGEWVETSYNTAEDTHTDGGTPLRKNFAGIGDYYDGTGFYALKPAASWVFDSTKYTWKPPISKPDDDGDYYWDEEAYQSDNSAGWTLHKGDH